ncbi:MAG: hypothetical protein HOV79_19535 [Hamadaea sp.]|nr:hypothetical protein [Hamadaea sp.]
MAELTDVPDPDGAKIAAHRLSTALGDLQGVVGDALALVKSMEAQAPLFGDDEGGRLFRQNYSTSATSISDSAQALVDGLATVGNVINTAINGTTATEDDNTRVIPA